MEAPVQHHHLPFPVSDTSDLKRAIRYTLKSPDDATIRYVSIRAKALGHTDLLPTHWKKMTTTTPANSLDAQFESLSTQHSLSVAKLKTVYFRGIDDFLASDIGFGSATMYGLARVQRFITERGATIDSDLLAQDGEETAPENGFELVFDSELYLMDIYYDNGLRIAELFEPGVTTGIAATEHGIVVDGILGSIEWHYELDTRTGRFSFTIL